MAQEDNQNGQNSSVVNKARSARKNIKRAYRAVRTLQAAQALVGGLSPIMWAIVGAMIMVVASTFFLAAMGGGPGVNAGTPTETPTANADCSSLEIPGLTDCSITGPSQIEVGPVYTYSFSGTYDPLVDPATTLDQYQITLTIPNGVIEFPDDNPPSNKLPGVYTKIRDGDNLKYIWKVSENQGLFTAVSQNGKEVKKFNFSIDVKALKEALAGITMLVEAI